MKVICPYCHAIMVEVKNKEEYKKVFGSHNYVQCPRCGAFSLKDDEEMEKLEWPQKKQAYTKIQTAD